MCGIVVYYGDAENRLTRVLSGMWAIIYRAPDSTGIGLIGSDLETVKIRREMGSVDKLIDRLIETPVFDEGELRIVSIMDDDCNSYSDFVAQNQQKLLAFEGFSSGERPFLKWSELTDIKKILEMEPGTPGNPEIQEYFQINTPKKFKAAINRLTMEFDLPLAVVEKLMCTGFVNQIKNKRHNSPVPVEENDLIHEFKLLFDRYSHDEAIGQPRRVGYKTGQKNPYARKYVWQYLKDVMVTLPSDYTTDAVANLFRNIDSSILAGSANNPEIDSRIQEIFENFWSMNKTSPPVHWHSLYQTERIYNVYGIAAAAALAWFQAEIYMKNMLQKAGKEGLPPGHIPGRTHPLLLKFMVQPVIGQGRWAMQSSISVRNAHPFVDEKKFRAIVLNGQFSSGIESRIKKYLTQVAGIQLRTENSTELFAMLWGYYFDTIFTANQRYKAIEKQHRLGLEELSVCSQSVDYGIFASLHKKTRNDIEEMSFIKAVETMITEGGQFAVAGITLVSKDRLLVAAHKRPVYIVKRQDTSDFMVVSDINAALGLFPQTLIQSVSIKLRKLMATYFKKSVIVEPGFFNDNNGSNESWFEKEKMALLAPFQVDVYALDQERVFARIQTKAGKEDVLRKLVIKDFSGKIRKDIKPEQTWLTPITFKKDFGRTFYEEHLLEIPALLKDLLERYICPDLHIPKFDIKERLLRRRFGDGFGNLNRIVLVGTGHGFRLAQVVEKNMEQFLTRINIIVVTPMDIYDIENSINRDRDLVVMISWSGTNSDMIGFASQLQNRNILMIGVTEKPFSDLALIIRKSAGVIPVFSGEEVTVVPLKSSICTLLILDLFCLYIAVSTAGLEDNVLLLKQISQMPEQIDKLLMDKKVTAFCQSIAKQTQHSGCHYIIDALYNTGSAHMGVLNLELNAWTSMGSAVDYSDMDPFIKMPIEKNSLILVNATNSQSLTQAVNFMEKLHWIGKTFFVMSYKNREKKEIQKYAQKAVFLPKVEDYFQPFIDITFMFLFGFYFGLARGRATDQMPRNMAKSVTAGRAKDSMELSVPDILDDIAVKNQILTDLDLNILLSQGMPVWIELSDSNLEQHYYTDLIKLCSVFYNHDPFATLFSSRTHNGLKSAAKFIFEHLAEDGIIIFVPMDRQAEASSRNFIQLWELFFKCPLHVEYPEKMEEISTEDSLVVVVASKPSDRDLLSKVFSHSNENMLWIGPEIRQGIFKEFSNSFGAYVFKNPDLSCPHEHVYFALSLFFATIMEYEFPRRARLLKEHFKLFLPAVNTILNDKECRLSIQKVLQENKAYKKTLFITSLRGKSISWKNKFNTHKTRRLESEIFGVSVYSHLVMVDPLVQEKYVKLESRQNLAKNYSEQDICAWENLYLAGADVDDFLKEFSMPFQADSVLPFMVDDQWYLPVLKPDYETNQDCLIIIDATSEKYFDSALDELSTFGSRYARIVVITQKGFIHDARLSNLKKYPLSNIILVPEMTDHDGNSRVISDYILPVVMNIIGSAMKFIDL